MREIKFRAWNFKTKVMKYFDFNILINGKEFIYLGDVSQFTGLKDKNGVEIYEGDIVKVGETCSFVVYWESCAGFRFNSYMEQGLINNLYKASEVGEVIGNIYENPELLK